MTEVWIIEFRDEYNPKTGDFENVVAHVSSTKKKAVDWVRENLDYSGGELGWWAVYREVVDAENDFLTKTELFFMTLEGVITDVQPLPPREGEEA